MASKQEKSRLADLLVEMRLLEDEAAQSAVAEARTSGRRLPKILADRRLIDEERLAKSVSTKLGLEAIALAGMRIHDRVVGLLPASVASKYGVLPIAIKRTNSAELLYLVMVDPLDTEAIGEVQRLTGRQVRVLMGTATEIDGAIEEHYRNRPAALPSAAAPAPAKATPSPARIGGGLPAPVSRAAPTPAASKSTPGAPPPRRGDSAIGPPPNRSAPPPKAKPTSSVLSPQPLAALVPPEQVPPVVRGVPVTPSPAADLYRPTLIDSPRPPELQQLFVAELQREAPLLRPNRPEPPRVAKPPPVSDLVFPSELDPPDSVSTRVDVFPSDDEATAQPGTAAHLEWDLAVKDWDRPDPSSARDGVVVVGALGSPSGSASGPTRSDSDPVTTEAALADIVLDEPVEGPVFLEELRRPEEPNAARAAPSTGLPKASRGAEPRAVPAEPGRKLSFAALLAESGARIEVDEGEDIKTSQLELSEINAAELRRETMRSVEIPRHSASIGAGTRRSWASDSWALELPVEMDEQPHPFDGPKMADVPVGLERTGIIPAIDWEKGEFLPPPLPAASRGQEVRPLAGSGDIPSTPEVVRLRGLPTTADDAVKDGEDPIQAIEEVALDPLSEELPVLEAEELDVAEPKRRSEPPVPVGLLPPDPNEAERDTADTESPTASLDLPPDSDNNAMPVIAPSSLASLMEDSPKPADTNSEPIPLPAPTRLFDESNRPEPVRSPLRPHEDEPTNPRIEAMAVPASSELPRPSRSDPATRAAAKVSRPAEAKRPIEPPIEDPTPSQDAVDRSSVLSALQSTFVPTGKAEAMSVPSAPAPAKDQVRAEARALVAALSQGESLSSVERVQLVLAIGRLLLKKGLITADELMDEL
ncbi:MAG: hypothetical protein IPG45_34635 [Deltaproteobacteria bacterium]|nr:hypothetical protein [Deltaproteobacteria bacterium]